MSRRRNGYSDTFSTISDISSTVYDVDKMMRSEEMHRRGYRPSNCLGDLRSRRSYMKPRADHEFPSYREPVIHESGVRSYQSEESGIPQAFSHSRSRYPYDGNEIGSRSHFDTGNGYDQREHIGYDRRSYHGSRQSSVRSRAEGRSEDEYESESPIRSRSGSACCHGMLCCCNGSNGSSEKTRKEADEPVGCNIFNHKLMVFRVNSEDDSLGADYARKERRSALGLDRSIFNGSTSPSFKDGEREGRDDREGLSSRDYARDVLYSEEYDHIERDPSRDYHSSHSYRERHGHAADFLLPPELAAGDGKRRRRRGSDKGQSLGSKLKFLNRGKSKGKGGSLTRSRVSSRQSSSDRSGGRRSKDRSADYSLDRSRQGSKSSARRGKQGMLVIM